MIAKDIMTKKVISLSPETNVQEAIKILIDNKISAAPVIDRKKALIGLVSEKDLLVSLDFIGEKKMSDVRVEEFMTPEVIMFPEDASVREIMQVLVRKNIKRVPIMRDNAVIGIVSRRDILRATIEKDG